MNITPQQRRRRGSPDTLEGLVQLGIAQRITPATDSGWKRYGNGRQFQVARTNHCKNPMPSHVANALPGQWATLGALNNTFTYTNGGVHDGITSKHVNIVGGVGAAVYAGLYLKFFVNSECAPGDMVTASAVIGEATITGCTIGFRVEWYTNANALVASSLGPSLAVGAAFATSSYTVTAPALAEKFYVMPLARNDFSVGDIQDYSICKILVEKAAAAGEYFDGTTPDCTWTGTAHASTSTLPISSLIYTGIISVDSTGVTALAGQTIYRQNASGTYYGPIVVAAAAYSAGDQAIIAANYHDPVAIWRVLAVGDYLFPLKGDSVGYRKLA